MAKHLEEMEFLQKYGSTEEFSRLHQLITNAWEVGSVPQAWKDASIVTIYKKCDRTDCGNYRGISLLSIAGKIFARILLNRLSTHITPEVVPETQCGFRGNRSTVDMIFCLRQLQEKCIVQDRPLYDHCICRLQQGVRYSWEERAMAATEEVWLPREVHNNDRGTTYWNDGEC